MKRVITVESVTLFMSVFNVYKNIYCRIGFNLSPPLGQFIGVVTTNVKVIKTQSEPNPGSFVGSLYISGKLPTYPPPKSTLISSHLGPNVGLGEG